MTCAAFSIWKSLADVRWLRGLSTGILLSCLAKSMCNAIYSSIERRVLLMYPMHRHEMGTRSSIVTEEGRYEMSMD